MNWVFQGKKYIYGSGTNTWFMTLKILRPYPALHEVKPIDCVHGPLSEDATRRYRSSRRSRSLTLPSEAEWFRRT